MENKNNRLGLNEYENVLSENINSIIFAGWKQLVGEHWEDSWTEIIFTNWDRYYNSPLEISIKNDAKTLETAFYFTTKYLNN